MRRLLLIIAAGTLVGLAGCTTQEAGTPVAAPGGDGSTSDQTSGSTPSKQPDATGGSTPTGDPGDTGGTTTGVLPAELKAQVTKLYNDPCQKPDGGSSPAQCKPWVQSMMALAPKIGEATKGKEDVTEEVNDVANYGKEYLATDCAAHASECSLNLGMLRLTMVYFHVL